MTSPAFANGRTRYGSTGSAAAFYSRGALSAGRAFGLSTTTASKRSQDLESTLRCVGRPEHRQLALTEADERLLARSADMLDELQSAFAPSVK
jgi:DNA-binding transcriptional LysR family regulator